MKTRKENNNRSLLSKLADYSITSMAMKAIKGGGGDPNEGLDPIKPIIIKID